MHDGNRLAVLTHLGKRFAGCHSPARLVPTLRPLGAPRAPGARLWARISTAWAQQVQDSHGRAVTVSGWDGAEASRRPQEAVLSGRLVGGSQESRRPDACPWGSRLSVRGSAHPASRVQALRRRPLVQEAGRPTGGSCPVVPPDRTCVGYPMAEVP